jgi:hypothetical protein
MRPFSTLSLAYILLIFATMGLVVGLSVQSANAATTYTVITVRITGPYQNVGTTNQNVGTTIYANGASKGTIYGEGSLTLIYANLTSDVTISVNAYTPEGYPYYGYQYYMYPGTSWGQNGLNGVCFFCRVNSQTATAGVNATLTFRYDPLFFLYVKSDRGNPEGSGWYPAGTLARVAVVTPTDETAGTRYRFDKWTGAYTNVNDNSNNPNNPVSFVFMDSPKIVEAAWVTQYRLTVNSPYGQPSGGGWYDKDQTATFSVTSSSDSGEGIRQVFNSWTGDYTGSSLTGTVAMNAPKIVTATWKTQYLLTIDPKGGQVDRTTQWLEGGTSVSVAATSPCNVVEKKSRMVFVGWHGATTSTLNTVALIMDSPKSLTATWKTQYYLIVETKRGTAAGEGWYDADSTAEFSVPSEVPMEAPFGTFGGRYFFSGWSGDSKSSTPRATVLMDKAHTVVADWSSDYMVTILIIVVIVAVGLAAVGLLARRRIFGKRRNKRRTS